MLKIDRFKLGGGDALNEDDLLPWLKVDIFSPGPPSAFVGFHKLCLRAK